MTLSSLRRVCLVAVCAMSGAGLSGESLADEVDRFVQNSLAETFSLATFLTHGETLRFGIWDFDPNEIAQLDDPELGSAESSELRRSIRNVSIPLTTKTYLPEWRSILTWGGSLSYLEVSQEGQLVVSENEPLDEFDERVFSAGVHAEWAHYLRPQWEILGRLEGRWLRYRNDTTFRAPTSESFRPILDGLLTNITVKALMSETAVGTRYRHPMARSVWTWSADVHYLVGDTYDTDRPAHDTQPEAWFSRSGLRIKDPSMLPFWRDQSLWLEAFRVDVGGDLKSQLDSSHYYELGGGWQLDLPGGLAFLDSVAIGINLNVGSVLRGGTLVLLFNEE